MLNNLPCGIWCLKFAVLLLMPNKFTHKENKVVNVVLYGKVVMLYGTVKL